MQRSEAENIAIANSIAANLQLHLDGRANADISEKLARELIDFQVAGRTLLVLAMEGGCQHSFATLIKLGANINATTPNTDTVLMLAAQQDNPIYIYLLVKQDNLNVFAKNASGETARSIAFRLSGDSYNHNELRYYENQILCIRSIADVLGSEKLAKEFYQLILDKKDAKIISTIEEYPALLSRHYGLNQVTILQLCLKYHSNAAAIALITKFNVDVNEADGDGFTPLMYVIKYQNDKQCFDAILNHPSINLFRVNANGQTASLYARHLGFLTHVDSILEAEKMAIINSDRRNPASFFHYCPLDIIKHYLVPMANDRRNNAPHK